MAGTELNTGQHWMYTLQRNKTMTVVPFKFKCLHKVLPSLIEFFCYKLNRSSTILTLNIFMAPLPRNLDIKFVHDKRISDMHVLAE